MDALNVRNIVLMRPIRSMIEFKQIIGRGTRDYDGKDFFTIWDFVKAHENFNDPEWDGEPIDPEPPRPGPNGPKPAEPTDTGGPDNDDGTDEPRAKIRIKLADGKTRAIRYLATTTYWGPDGKPISVEEFMERLFGDLTGLLTDEDHLRKDWSDPDSRETFMKQLSDRGYDTDRLNDIRKLVDAPDTDLFDVLGYVMFTNDPKTRHDRADAVKQSGLADVREDMKALLVVILDAYELHGEDELATPKLGQFLTARYGSVGEAKNRLGGLPEIKDAFHRMQAQLYSR